MGIFSKKPKPFERERSLTEDPPKGSPVINTNIEDEAEKEVQEIFSDIKDNIILSNELLNLLDEKCRATHVPVDPIVQDVRAAVARKDPSEADGARISFHLFLTAVKKYEQVQLNYTLAISESMTGNPSLDSTTTRRFKYRIIHGISDEDLLVFDSVYLLNYAIHKFQDIFNVPEILKISPPSEHPEGAAYGAMKLVIAIAFASAIDVLNKELIQATRNVGRGSSSSSVSSSAPEEFTFSRMDELALEKISQNDYKIILDYVIGYIYPSLDPKYDLWINYVGLRQSRNTSVDMYRYYPTYSHEANIRLNLGDKLPRSGNEDYASDHLKDEFLAAFKNNFKNMCATTSQSMRFNSNEQRALINNVAQTSAYRVTKDQICCLFRIMAKHGISDKKTIKLIKVVLRAASKTLSVNLSARYAKKTVAQLSGANADFMYIKHIKHRVMGVIGRINDSWFSKMNTLIMENLYVKCKLFHDMFKSMLDFVEDIVSEIGSNETDSEKQQSIIVWRNIETVQTKWQLRGLSHMDMILSSILEQSLDECYNMSDDVVDNMIDEVVGGLSIPSNQYTIDIPDDLRERYFSDNKPIRVSQSSSLFGLSNTTTIPAIDKFNQPETSEEVIRNILKTCKMEISDEEIKKMLKESDGSSR